jgi:RHS repeat-associated protein
MVVQKSGYLYVYVSNENNMNVYFDDVVVNHKSGPVLEVTNFRAFGSEIATLGEKAYSKTANAYRYNGKELQSKEFSDGSGIDEYDYGFRFYDPNLGRWNVNDPLSEKSRRWSPYVYCADNPLRFIDPDGMAYMGYGNNPDQTVADGDAVRIQGNDVTTVNGKVVGSSSGGYNTSFNNEGDEETPSNGQPLKFDDLWNNYDDVEHTDENTGNDLYDNHCAIKVSDALLKSGVNLTGYSGATCSSNCDSKSKHPLRAEELASWLQKHKISGVGKPVFLTGSNYEKSVEGKKGIIYYKDFWHRKGETGDTRTGDHIDLWKENKLASKGLFMTWLRRTFPNFSENYLDMSDLRKSKQVIFWEMQ